MKKIFDNINDDGLSDSDPLNDLKGHFDDMFQVPGHHEDSIFSGNDLEHTDFHVNIHDPGNHDILSGLNNLHSPFHGHNDPGILDTNPSGWEDTPSGLDDKLYDPGIPGMNDSNWNDGEDPFNSEFSNELQHSSDSDFQNHEHDLLSSDIHHTDWADEALNMSKVEYPQPVNEDIFHNLNSVHAHSVHFSSSTDSSHPYITMSDSGYVYFNGDKEIGHISKHTVYNKSDNNCGHWTTDGKVYDYNDNLVGWVHPDGHVYAKGKDGDLEVYKTNKGVAGGAAYLLLVWCGGQTHI